MKIEKINDKQIRCTLTGEDMASRQLKLSELAYGSEKAKSLFHDMMQQAKQEFGFDPNNSPIMVEAIPMAPDSLMLIISLVDDPEELDARFSQFSDPQKEEAPADKQFFGADDILDLFRKITAAGSSMEEKQKQKAENPADSEQAEAGSSPDTEESPTTLNLLQLFHFSTLDGVIDAAKGVNPCYDEQNTLYKDNLTGDYLLVLHQNSCSPENFNRISNMLSEYSQVCRFNHSSEAFLQEHMECIVKDRALQTLAQL